MITRSRRTHSPIQVSLGATTVSLLRLGALHVRLAEWIGLAEWPPAYAPLFAEPIAVPVQYVHLALPGRSVLVDACHPELFRHTPWLNAVALLPS